MGEIRDNVQTNLILFLSQRNMSQKDLAKILGVSQSAVTNWVKGKNSPDIETVAQICKIFDISISDLLGAPNAHEIILSPEEIMHMQKYRNLDDTDKIKTAAYMDGLLAADKYQSLQREQVG